MNRSPAAAADNAHEGYVALEQHRDADAVRWLTDAARMGPRAAITWFDLGIARQRTGRPAEAAAAYARALELDPANEQYRQAAGL